MHRIQKHGSIQNEQMFIEVFHLCEENRPQFFQENEFDVVNCSSNGTTKKIICVKALVA